MENLDNFLYSDIMQKLDNTMQKTLKPRKKPIKPNRNKILTLYKEDFENIKEGIKAYFKKHHGWYPSNSEGTCKDCSEKVVRLVNGDLIFGWFKTDTKLEKSLIIKRTENGLHSIAETEWRDSSKISHWWVEIGNLIIDLTAEQFNEYLKPKAKKYDRIEVLKKNEPKAKRYFGEDRFRNGKLQRDDYNEVQYEKENQNERANNSISC